MGGDVLDCTYREVIPDTNHFASPLKEAHPFFLSVTRSTAHFDKLVGQQIINKTHSRCQKQCLLLHLHFLLLPKSSHSCFLNFVFRNRTNFKLQIWNLCLFGKSSVGFLSGIFKAILMQFPPSENSAFRFFFLSSNHPVKIYLDCMKWNCNILKFELKSFLFTWVSYMNACCCV